MACGHLLPASATHVLVMALMVCRAATVQGVPPSGVHPSDMHPPGVQPTGMRLPAPPHEDGYCRLMELGYVDYATYIDQAFTRCYTHVYWSENAVFTTWWRSNCTGGYGFPHWSAYTLLQSYLTKPSDLNRWLSCCEAAIDCCHKHMLPEKPVEGSNTGCPATWDGLQCWGEAKAGMTVQGICPEYVYTFCPYYDVAYSTKDCVAEGDVAWFQQYDECRGFDKEFTFYNECEKSYVINELIRDRYMVRDVLWGISLVFILPAIIIFLSYRQLRTRNNIVHVNFFTAHLLSSLFFLIYDVTISLDALDGQAGTSTADGGVGCVIFTVLVHKYLRLTSYAWMFCEGFHLHQLIAAAFQKTSMPALYIIGWVFPVVPVTIYVILRATNPNYDAWCWAAPAGGLEWIITSCIIAAFFFSVLFLANIMRVVLTKFRRNDTYAVNSMRRTMRMVIALLPLLGFTYFPTLYRPPCYVKGYHTYQIINSVLEGIQGMLVAFLFCYLNPEVHACLRRTLYHKFPSMRPVPKGRPSVSGTQVTNDYSMTQPPNNNEEAPKNPPAAQTKF